MPTSSFDKVFIVTDKKDIDKFKRALGEHVWRDYKGVCCCADCGIVRSESNIHDECKGKIEITLRD